MTSSETFNICLEFTAMLKGGTLHNRSSFPINVGNKLNGIPL
jgi:hypothetical protein